MDVSGGYCYCYHTVLLLLVVMVVVLVVRLLAGRQDVGERNRGGGGHEVRPWVHLPLLRHRLEDADVRDGEPAHPHRREEGS